MDKRVAFLLLVLVAVVVVFETGQQLYYLRKFKLAEDATFFFLLQRQAYRWLVWAVLGVPLFFFIGRLRRGNFPLNLRMVKGLVGILILVAMAVCCIAMISLLTSGSAANFSTFVND
ncbi:MAG: hypothetical protein AAGF89_14225, partial [Bacteroidota bacterium]